MATISSVIDLVDGDTAPSAPASGSQSLYIRSGTAYKKDSGGTETPLVSGVSSTSNSDGTLTISPTTGAVVASRAAITGDIAVNAGSNVSAIGTNKVTNTMLAQIAAHSYKGNNTGSTANAADITATQLTADLNAATTSLQGMMSASDKSQHANWFNKAVYNVLDNGISTSNSGATNVTAWNALMTTLANSCGTVYFPSAAVPYDFASVCNIPAGVHIRVQGGGPTSRTSDAFGTIIRTTSGTADMFTCSDWYNEFNSLTFRSSVTRTAGAVINSGNNVGITVINCNFNSQFNGIVFSGGANAGNLGFVDNCHFTDTVNFSMQIDGTNANTIIRGVTADCAPASVSHLEINACGSVLVSDCDFIRATNNMRLNPDSGTKGVFSVYCNNVFFDTAAGSSVKYMGGAAGTNVQRSKYVNCWFSGSVTGCEFAAVTSTNKPAAIDFVNCDIYSNSAFGILATEVQDFSLNNCRVAGNSTAGVRTNAAASSVTKFNIQNCTIGPTHTIAANGIGVDIVAGTYGAYNVTGNNVAGNTSNNNIVDAGTVATTDMKKIGDNIGHLIKGAIATLAAPLTVPVTTETLVLAGRIPANSVLTGQVFRIRAIGVMAGANVPTWRVRVGANGTVADAGIPFVAAAGTGVANGRTSMDVLLTIRSSTTVNAEGYVYSGTTAAAVTISQPTLGAATTAAITSTAAWFIDITLAQTINSCAIQSAIIEAL